MNDADKNSPFSDLSSCSVCCPYPLLASPCVLSLIALIFTYVAAFDCNFYSITLVNSTESRSFTLGVGLWTVESPTYDIFDDDYYSYCTGYQTYSSYQSLNLDDLDGAMNAARVFAMMTSIAGLICFILILIPSCVSFGNNDQFAYIVAGISVFLGIFTMLDLVSEYASSALYHSVSLLSV